MFAVTSLSKTAAETFEGKVLYGTYQLIRCDLTYCKATG